MPDWAGAAAQIRAVKSVETQRPPRAEDGTSRLSTDEFAWAAESDVLG
jgi:hypothetical protein